MTGESYPVYIGPDTLVWWKESGLPTVPLRDKGGATLFSFVKEEFPEIARFPGRNPWEGGVVHRLDTPTSGLVLIARDERALSSLLGQQRDGLLRKEYIAHSSKGRAVEEGFPSYPFKSPERGEVIESHFRAFGPGRKSVRPVLPGKRAEGPLYSTSVSPEGELSFRCSLSRGFRHQIRCHLAWAGYPVLGDTLYGGEVSDVFGLEAVSITYIEPSTGKERTVSVQPRTL